MRHLKIEPFRESASIFLLARFKPLPSLDRYISNLDFLFITLYRKGWSYGYHLIDTSAGFPIVLIETTLVNGTIYEHKTVAGE